MKMKNGTKGKALGKRWKSRGMANPKLTPKAANPLSHIGFPYRTAYLGCSYGVSLPLALAVSLAHSPSLSLYLSPFAVVCVCVCFGHRQWHTYVHSFGLPKIDVMLYYMENTICSTVCHRLCRSRSRSLSRCLCRSRRRRQL